MIVGWAPCRDCGKMGFWNGKTYPVDWLPPGGGSEKGVPICPSCCIRRSTAFAGPVMVADISTTPDMSIRERQRMRGWT